MNRFAEPDHPPGNGWQPGFWQVPVGSLVEVGDQYLDRQGRAQTFPLEQVGRPVTPGQVVLRVERRGGSR